MITLSQEQKDRLTDILMEDTATGGSIGSALCILHQGRELYRGNFGYADGANKVPIQDDTIYRLYSMTKPITSTAIMILMERGLLSLEDPVSKYLEGFLHQTVFEADGTTRPLNTPTTIQHLLNMTAGLYYPDNFSPCGKLTDQINHLFLERYGTQHPLNTIEMANLFGQTPLGFEPGTRWNYSICADVLGAIVEVISGKRFGRFLQEEIFTPLQMKDTSFVLPKSKLPRYSKQYDRDANGVLFENEVHLIGLVNRDLDNAFESGGAGLVSTVDDYGRFASMLANLGELSGTRILKPETVDFMRTSSLPKCAQADLTWESLKGFSYSNLFRMITDSAATGLNAPVGSFGWDGWTGNYFFVDPKNHLVFLYFVQICNGVRPELMRRLSQIVYENI